MSLRRQDGAQIYSFFSPFFVASANIFIMYSTFILLAWECQRRKRLTLLLSNSDKITTRFSLAQRFPPAGPPVLRKHALVKPPKQPEVGGSSPPCRRARGGTGPRGPQGARDSPPAAVPLSCAACDASLVMPGLLPLPPHLKLRILVNAVKNVFEAL